jgi:hypothetical protein
LSSRREAGWYLLASLALAGAVAWVQPPLHDPDSTLYAAMSSQLAGRPLAQWLAPQWPPGRAKAGRFVEHTAVSLWPGAALERLGVPAGALVANMLCAVALLWLVSRLAAALAPEASALAVASWGLSIIAVQYCLRANHEVWWATAAVAALWAIASGAARWVAVACVVAACCVKGVLGLDTLLLTTPLAWVLRGRAWTLRLVASSLVAAAVFVALYEAASLALVGQSFLGEYLSIQLGYVGQAEAHGWLTKPRNLVFYLGKLAWFSLPGALLLGWALWRQRAWLREDRARPALALLLGVGLVVVSTSLMSRHAARYIFPCYPALAVVGAVAAEGSALARWLQARPRAVLGGLLLVALARVLLSEVTYRDVNLLPGPATGALPSARRRELGRSSWSIGLAREGPGWVAVAQSALCGKNQGAADPGGLPIGASRLVRPGLDPDSCVTA